MRKGLRRILFAVRDVETVTPGALRKLADLAQGSTAVQIELYHALTESVVVPPPGGTPKLNEVLDAVATEQRQRLAKLARTPALRDLRVEVQVDWDYPAHEAVIRRAVAIGADLVVGEAHHHARIARPFLQNTDWELIRQCPIPLLLLKNGRRYRNPVILAAVDPFHAGDKPASLDKALLAAGAQLADHLGGTLHLMHAWLPMTALVPTAASAPVPIYLPDDVEAEHEKQTRKAFDQLAARAGIKPAARHLVLGSVTESMEAVTKRCRASIVVMGAISRRGLQRLVIGNTAERMLGHLDCDLLVVKPPGFRSPVPARKTARPRLIAPLPI